VLGNLSLTGALLINVPLMFPRVRTYSTPVWSALGIFVFSSLLAGLPAVVTGIVALALKRPARAAAIIGLVLGALAALLWTVSIVTFIVQTPI
jgi:hypothetical protein